MTYLSLQNLGAVPHSRRQEVLDTLKGITGISVLDFDLNSSCLIPILHNADKVDSAVEKISSNGPKVSIIKSKDSDLSNNNFQTFYSDYLSRLNTVLNSIDMQEVAALANACFTARANGNSIFIAGNGGSASTASHFANDFAKHGFDNDKFTFRVVSLTDNTPLMTAISNDFGYENLFKEQLRNLLRPADVLITISSSGNSPNVIKAVEYANERGAITFGIVGFGGGKLSQLVKHQIMIPTEKGEYGVMEDGSLIIGHIISNYISRVDHT